MNELLPEAHEVLRKFSEDTTEDKVIVSIKLYVEHAKQMGIVRGYYDAVTKVYYLHKQIDVREIVWISEDTDK
jgi:hypothetical protein